MSYTALIRRHFSIHWQVYLVACICLFLFFVPFSHAGYDIGGDHSQLYYLYPKEYLRNYLFDIASGNVLGGTTGYTQAIFTAPLISFFLLAKTVIPMVNTQHLFYGVNLSLGFLFCYLFFRLCDKTKTTVHILIAIAASCLYITSPYLVKTLLGSGLISIYLIMLVPFFLYTFVRGLEENDLRYIVVSALGIVVFSSSLLSAPWFLPVIIVLLPYFIYAAFRYGFFFWKAIGIFIIVSIGLHWYWLVHGLMSVIASRLDKTLASVIVSGKFIQNAESDMYSMLFLNGSAHQIAGYLRTSWEDHVPMPPWALIGSIPVFVVCLAGMKLKTIPRQKKVLFGVILFSFTIALFMITPNMGTWNMDVFLWLNRTVPLFSMFRNMSGKFGLAMAFVSAFMVFLSLNILTDTKQHIRKWLPFILGVILLVYQLPLFLTDQVFGEKKSYMTGLSPAYGELARYVSTIDTTKRFVWYPMTFPAYTPIRDETATDAWYLGLSPLQALSGKSDIAGFYELQTDRDPYRNWTILELFKQKKYEEILSILASYNIGYVITMNEKLPDSVQKRLDLFSFMAVQDQEYKDTLLGEKVYDVGNVYSVYAISPSYSFDTAFLTDDPLDIHASKEAVSIRKVKSNVYEVTLPTTLDSRSLVVLLPFHVLWTAHVPEAQDDVISLTNHRIAYGYGNAWDIEKKKDMTAPVTLTIEFMPNRFVIPSAAVSIGVFFICCLYVCYPRKKRHI